MKVLPFPSPKPVVDAADDAAVERPEADRALGDEGPRRYDRITIRAITVAVAVSLVIHILLLVVPLIAPADPDLKAPADEIGPLSVTIAQSKPQPQAQPQTPAPAPVPRPDPAPPAAEPAPKTPRPPVRPRPAPQRPRPQIALEQGRTPPFVVPPPVTATPPQPEVAPAPAPTPPPEVDFSEAIAQRQRERRAQSGGAPDEVLESDDQRANRIAKANIAAQQRSASPGQDPNEAGGIFELRRTGLRDAEFVFNGWNRDFRRKWAQQIEVKQGNNPDIRIAVIRRMIDVIREQKPGDFEWQSHRLGKVFTKSARVKDQPELEIFLMREFYPEDPRAR